jgi:hypothetical protein
VATPSSIRITALPRFKYEGPGPGKGGTGVLTVDDKELARKTIPHTIPLLMSIDETFDVGVDRPLSLELWISAETGSAYQLHLLTAPRDSDVWIYSKFDLDIYLTWGAEQLDGEDCHFVSPSLSHWRALIDRISKAESGPMGREKEHEA